MGIFAKFKTLAQFHLLFDSGTVDSDRFDFRYCKRIVVIFLLFIFVALLAADLAKYTVFYVVLFLFIVICIVTTSWPSTHYPCLFMVDVFDTRECYPCLWAINMGNVDRHL